jgi:hypothetical protein
LDVGERRTMFPPELLPPTMTRLASIPSASAFCLHCHVSNIRVKCHCSSQETYPLQRVKRVVHCVRKRELGSTAWGHYWEQAKFSRPFYTHSR